MRFGLLENFSDSHTLVEYLAYLDASDLSVCLPREGLKLSLSSEYYCCLCQYVSSLVLFPKTIKAMACQANRTVTDKLNIKLTFEEWNKMTYLSEDLLLVFSCG